MRLAAIYRYPIKGGAAIAAHEGVLDVMGLAGDRRFCLARPGGRVFTQRDNAELARLRTSPRADRLLLEFDGDALEVPLEQFRRLATLQVWSRQAEVRIADGSVNATLTQWFGTPLELAALAKPVVRQGVTLAMGDAGALLVANAASLDALNDALHSPVPMAQFRPNLVVGGAGAYDEDHWGRLQIGDAVLVPVHACGRCEVITIDQEFGAALGPEPLRTLSRIRQRDGEPVFGVRYAVERPGTLRAGDEVRRAA